MPPPAPVPACSRRRRRRSSSAAAAAEVRWAPLPVAKPDSTAPSSICGGVMMCHNRVACADRVSSAAHLHGTAGCTLVTCQQSSYSPFFVGHGCPLPRRPRCRPSGTQSDRCCRRACQHSGAWPPPLCQTHEPLHHPMQSDARPALPTLPVLAVAWAAVAAVAVSHSAALLRSAAVGGRTGKRW